MKFEPIADQEKNILDTIYQEAQAGKHHVQATIRLLEDGNTVPFIARYRKEATGGLDEEQIRFIEERLHYLRNLWKRKEEVLRTISEQGQLTEELQHNIWQATKLQEVEDYYRPYKPKRRTRATKAKEKGLEPLALWLLQFTQEDPFQKAEAFLSAEKEVDSVQTALQGAQDIIAEKVADEATLRQWVRNKTFAEGRLVSEVRDEETDDKNVYDMYYDYHEAVKNIVPHRVLALNRGEKEGILKISVQAPVDEIEMYMEKRTIQTNGENEARVSEQGKKESPSIPYVQAALIDSYKRLIAPAVEREIRRYLTEKAEEQAIQVFAKNLKPLLLQAPVRGKKVLAIDPAYRTGCKLAALDGTGKLLTVDVIYPTPPRNEKEKAKDVLNILIDKYAIEIIAIGNGTASRETELFVAEVIQQRAENLAYMIINEAGASVYSASQLAKEEFPELDVAERSAVSIGRRLQDPLAELVKIDPKSIGVGQYQHDVSQSRLHDNLSFVVETAVNQVGVDVNTASVSLLQYVSGLNKSVARQVVRRREEQGPYRERKELKEVPRLGAKTYEQAIGFMRIFDGRNALDMTPIHPESYAEAERLVSELGFTKEQIGEEEFARTISQIDVHAWAEKLKIGVPTLQDIVDALQKPRRDPREDLVQPLLKSDVLQIEDLHEGMSLEGTIRNVVDFGAFVDIGLKNDALIHISQLKRQFVRHPLDVVSVGDIVQVWVKDVDVKRERVGLTMIEPN